MIYHDPSTNVKVQATMPCSKAAAEQRAGRTGRNCEGRCVRLVTQDQWNRMPYTDPMQPRLTDHTQLYLRLFMPDVKDLRETLLNKMSMTKPMRLRAHDKLSLLGMYNQDGDITKLGEFAADLGCEPENFEAVLLWYAKEFQVMENALTIFAILEPGPAFVAKERRVKVAHPDGDMHSLVNGGACPQRAVWIQQFPWLYYHQPRSTWSLPAIHCAPTGYLRGKDCLYLHQNGPTTKKNQCRQIQWLSDSKEDNRLFQKDASCGANRPTCIICPASSTAVPKPVVSMIRVNRRDLEPDNKTSCGKMADVSHRCKSSY